MFSSSFTSADADNSGETSEPALEDIIQENYGTHEYWSTHTDVNIRNAYDSAEEIDSDLLNDGLYTSNDKYSAKSHLYFKLMQDVSVDANDKETYKGSYGSPIFINGNKPVTIFFVRSGPDVDGPKLTITGKNGFWDDEKKVNVGSAPGIYLPKDQNLNIYGVGTLEVFAGDVKGNETMQGKPGKHGAEDGDGRLADGGLGGYGLGGVAAAIGCFGGNGGQPKAFPSNTGPTRGESHKSGKPAVFDDNLQKGKAGKGLDGNSPDNIGVLNCYGNVKIDAIGGTINPDLSHELISNEGGIYRTWGFGFLNVNQATLGGGGAGGNGGYGFLGAKFGTGGSGGGAGGTGGGGGYEWAGTSSSVFALAGGGGGGGISGDFISLPGLAAKFSKDNLRQSAHSGNIGDSIRPGDGGVGAVVYCNKDGDQRGGHGAQGGMTENSTMEISDLTQSSVWSTTMGSKSTFKSSPIGQEASIHHVLPDMEADVYPTNMKKDGGVWYYADDGDNVRDNDKASTVLNRIRKNVTSTDNILVGSIVNGEVLDKNGYQITVEAKDSDACYVPGDDVTKEQSRIEFELTIKGIKKDDPTISWLCKKGASSIVHEEGEIKFTFYATNKMNVIKVYDVYSQDSSSVSAPYHYSISDLSQTKNFNGTKINDDDSFKQLGSITLHTAENIEPYSSYKIEDSFTVKNAYNAFYDPQSESVTRDNDKILVPNNNYDSFFDDKVIIFEKPTSPVKYQIYCKQIGFDTTKTWIQPKPYAKFSDKDAELEYYAGQIDAYFTGEVDGFELINDSNYKDYTVEVIKISHLRNEDKDIEAGTNYATIKVTLNKNTKDGDHNAHNYCFSDSGKEVYNEKETTEVIVPFEVKQREVQIYRIMTNDNNARTADPSNNDVEDEYFDHTMAMFTYDYVEGEIPIDQTYSNNPINSGSGLYSISGAKAVDWRPGVQLWHGRMTINRDLPTEGNYKILPPQDTENPETENPDEVNSNGLNESNDNGFDITGYVYFKPKYLKVEEVEFYDRQYADGEFAAPIKKYILKQSDNGVDRWEEIDPLKIMRGEFVKEFEVTGQITDPDCSVGQHNAMWTATVPNTKDDPENVTLDSIYSFGNEEQCHEFNPDTFVTTWNPQVSSTGTGIMNVNANASENNLVGANSSTGDSTALVIIGLILVAIASFVVYKKRDYIRSIFKK